MVTRPGTRGGTSGGRLLDLAKGWWAWWRETRGAAGIVLPLVCALLGWRYGLDGVLFWLAVGLGLGLAWPARAARPVVLGVLGLAGVAWLVSDAGVGSTLFVMGLPFVLVVGGILGIVALLNRGRIRGHYDAHFATRAETRDMRASSASAGSKPGGGGLPSDGEGVLLAVQGREPIEVYPGFDGRRELGHVLVCGPSRSGKGLHLVTNLLTWAGSVMALDVKGELYDLTASWRGERLANRVRVLDPSGVGDRYDPFAELSYSPEALKTALALVMEAEGDQQPVFAQRASSALYAAVLGARIEARPALPYVRELTGEGPMAFVEHLSSLGDGDVRRALVDFLGSRPEEMEPMDFRQDRFLSSTWSTMTSRLSPFFSEGVLKMCGGSDFTAADLVERPTTLYLRFRETELDYTKKVFQVVTMALVSGLMRRGDLNPGEEDAPMLLALDEAGRTPIPRLDNLVSTISGRGMSALVYVQDLGQLEAAYGRARAQAIRGNCHTQVFYRPTDHDTAEFLSKRMGSTTVEDVRESYKGLERSLSVGQLRRELLTPDEVRTQVGSDEVFVFVGSRPPIWAKRLQWFDVVPGAAEYVRNNPPSEPPPLPNPDVRLGGPCRPATGRNRTDEDDGSQPSGDGRRGQKGAERETELGGYVEPDY
jgi:type IV secretion system protein VirD4